jgi:hypothetical protein
MAGGALATLNAEWLLLVDGADDVEAMAGLWPPGRNGNILYTSRNQMLKDFASDAVFEVAEMEDDDAVQLLLDAARLRPASDEVMQLAKDIVARLGHLALAIDQAGAYMARGECRIYDFLATFERHRASLLSVDAYRSASLYKRAVYATWELSHSAIQRISAGQLQRDPLVQVARNAIQLLNMLAYFHYEHVTEDMFRRAAENPKRSWRYPPDVDPFRELASDGDLPHNLLTLEIGRTWDAQPFRRCVCMLTSYSLLWSDRISGTISMHRLVHQWAFDRLLSQHRLTSIRSSAATLAFSSTSSFKTEDYAIRRQLLPHIVVLYQRAAVDDVDPIRTAAEMDGVFDVLLDSGRCAQAALLQRRALDLKRKLLGSEHQETLRSMDNFALSVGAQGRVAEAEALHRQTHEIRKRVLGPEHPDTLHCMVSLAMAIRDQGRAAEAEARHWQAHEIRKRVLGPEHRDTLLSMVSLAMAIRDQGRAAEAEALHRQTLEVSERVLGSEHPDTLYSIGVLALTIREQGRAAEAEALHRQQHELTKRVLGPEHPDTLHSMGNLALSIQEQGRAAEAEALHRQTHEISRRVLGPEHPSTLTAMYNCALTMHELGNTSDAFALMLQCYELRKEKIGVDHPHTKEALDALNFWHPR